MNKQAILDAISSALDGVGLSDGMGDDMYDENGMTAQNEVPIWSKMQAGTLGQGPGAIHDKSSLMAGREMSKPPEVGNYGMPKDDESEEMMTALGLV